MEIKGKVIEIKPVVTGVSKAGNVWRKCEFVMEIPGRFPQKVAMQLFGEDVDKYPIFVGQEITASIEIESHEFNGRWYTSVTAWKIA